MDGQTLLVAETFGSFQGEGPSTGQAATFLRLSRCNLSCPRCDTPYTWDWRRYDPRAEASRMSAATVIEKLLSGRPDLVVITGGEPLLQQATLVPVVAAVTGVGRRVEIETNGTVAPLPGLVVPGVSFNVSPKLRSFAAAQDARNRIVAEALAAFVGTGQAVFKFVAAGPADLDEIGDLQAAHGLAPVWVMPDGTTERATLDVMRTVADGVLARGWNLTGRLHVLVWGDVRGR